MNKGTHFFSNILIHRDVAQWISPLKQLRLWLRNTFAGSFGRFGADAALGDALAFVLVVFLAGGFLCSLLLNYFCWSLGASFWWMGFLLATAFLAEAGLVLAATFFVDADFLVGAFALVLGADLVAAGLDFWLGGGRFTRHLVGLVIKIKL